MAEKKRPRLTPRQLRKLFAAGILSASGKGEKRAVAYNKAASTANRRETVQRAAKAATTGGGKLRPVERYDGVQARVTGDVFTPGKPVKVRVVSPEARAAIRQGGEEGQGAREYLRGLRRSVYEEARRQSFDMGREMNRSLASKGGKKAAITKAKIKEAQGKLSGKSTGELLAILQDRGSLILPKAAKAELKKRGIEQPKGGRRRAAAKPVKPIMEKKPKAPRKQTLQRAAGAAKG